LEKILISTMERVILWDGKPITIMEGDRAKGNANYHGVSWSQDKIFVACSIDFRYCIAVFDRDFKMIDVLYDDLHQIHQIFWHEKLYVTNTGKNRVDIWDGKWSHKYWNPSPCDIDHVNGIWIKDTTAYVTEYRPKRESIVRICDLDLDSKKEIIIGKALHNAYVEDNKLYNCVCHPKGLHITDLETGRKTNVVISGHEKNLVRGLARSKDFWYVGMSQWVDFRGDRCTGDAIVAVLDNDLKEVDRIEIKDASPVCELRLLSGDLAHNGVDF